MLLLYQSPPLLQADSETTLLLCLMGVILLTAFALLLAANRIGKIQKQSEAEKKCPYCAELIKKDAVICRFCGRDLPVPSLSQQPAAIEKVVGKLPQDQPALVPGSEPVAQGSAIQEQFTQHAPKPKSPKPTKTMNRSLLGLGAITVILLLCVGLAVLLGGSKLLELSKSSSDSSSSYPSPVPSSPFVIPSGDFKISWDTYDSQYNSLGGILTIRRQGSKYTQTRVMSDGSCSTTDLTVISESDEIKVTDSPGNIFGDYMLISSSGYLYFYDNEGIIYGIPPLEQTSATECVQPQAEQGKEINVTMALLSAESIGGNQLRIIVVTNLPDEMELMMDLKDSGSYWAQDNVTVRNGELATIFGNVTPGNYRLTVTSPVVEVQPENVKAVLGEGSSNMVGDLITFDPSWNSYFLEYKSNIEVK